MGYQNILLEKEDKIAVLTINRPKAILDMVSYPSLNVCSKDPAFTRRGLVGNGLIGRQARCYTTGLFHYRNLWQRRVEGSCHFNRLPGRNRFGLEVKDQQYGQREGV